MITKQIRKVLPTYGYTIPDHATLWQATEDTKFTPDIATLEEYEWQLYFATDETKKDHLKHDLVGPEAQYRFPAFTQESFHYWDHDAPFLPPIPMKVTGYVNAIPFFPPIAKIKGQVYLIRPQRFLELDRYKQNTVEYQRERIRVIVPYRQVLWLKDHNLDSAFGVQELFARSEYAGSSVKTSEERVAIIRAWMYIGKPEFWDPLISAFDYRAVETFHAKNRRWCETYYNIRRPPLPPKLP
jgi:hypothetical protein